MHIFNSVFATALLVATTSWAQQPPPPVNLDLRCDRVESGNASKRVSSASLGFGNPTSPETTEGTGANDGTVLIEIRGATGRLHLSQFLLTPKRPKGDGSWFPLADLTLTDDTFSASFAVTPRGRQTVQISRKTGVADLVGYGDHALHGICHVDKPLNKF